MNISSWYIQGIICTLDQVVCLMCAINMYTVVTMLTTPQRTKDFYICLSTCGYPLSLEMAGSGSNPKLPGNYMLINNK